MTRLGVSGDGMMVRLGNFFFRYRDFLFPAVFVLLAVLLRPGFPAGSQKLDCLGDLVGLGLAVTGQSLRAAVIGFAYVKRGGKDKRIYADSLVQEGFFAHARNPLYVGNILVLLGLILIHGSPWFILIGIPFYLVAYLSITVAEEDFLYRKFGEEYEEYCRRVPRFIPRFAGLGKSIEGMQFDWRRVIRKEYGSTFVWVLCAIALIVWERYRHFGYTASRGVLVCALVVFAPILCAYVTARWMKKTGRLGHD